MMRRTLMLVFVALLVFAGAAPAVAGGTSNTRYSEIVVEGAWWDGEWGDEVISSGYVSARQQTGADVGEMWFESSVGVRIVCDAGTPEDPNDDYIGYEYTTHSGYGPTTVSVGKSYRTGSASATVLASTWTWSECGFEGEAQPENGFPGNGEELEVSISLTGTSSLIREKGSYAFHYPGQSNSHERWQNVYRDGSGTIVANGDATPTSWGRVGKASWSSHSNWK